MGKSVQPEPEKFSFDFCVDAKEKEYLDSSWTSFPASKKEKEKFCECSTCQQGWPVSSSWISMETSSTFCQREGKTSSSSRFHGLVSFETFGKVFIARALAGGTRRRDSKLCCPRPFWRFRPNLSTSNGAPRNSRQNSGTTWPFLF